MTQDHRTGDHVHEELLADLVGGTISDADRRRVEPHLQACATCREEVELASHAVDALAGLPELEVPWNVTRPVIEQAGGGRRGRVWGERVTRIAWGTGVAAAAAVIGIVMWVGLRGPGDSAEMVAPAADTPVQEGGGAATDAASPEDSSNDGRRVNSFVVQRKRLNYQVQDVEHLADELAGTASALEGEGDAHADSAGSPQETTEAAPPATKGATPRGAVVSIAGDPLGCVLNAASVPPDAQAVRVIVARFQSQRAFIGAFLEGRPPDRLSVWVAGRPGCNFLHYTSRPVP
jgi:hypothetical protein